MKVNSYIFKHNIVKKHLIKNNAEAIIFISIPNRFWISGIETMFGYVIITKQKSFILVDARDYEYCKNNLKNFQCVLYNDFDSLKNLIKKLKIKTLLFESEYITYFQLNETLNKLSVKLVPSLTTILRAQKTDEEISNLKISAKIACSAIEYIKSKIKVGMSELEVKKLLTIFMLEKGAAKNSFDLIVAFGENTANPHHQPSKRKLKLNEFITCDIGCIYNGYCSDITRTFWLGKASKKMLEMYNLVLESNKLGIEKAKNGITGKELDNICRSYIGKNKKYGHLFVHGTGHGVGIELHELPNVKQVYEEKILENSVITIEPGVYEPNFGGVRIEDTVLIKKQSNDVLTKFSKK